MLRKLHLTIGILIGILAAIDAIIAQLLNQGYT